MHLLMWSQGGKHLHAHGNDIDLGADRFIFYDHTGSTVYDALNNTWYRDGELFAPSYPLTFTLSDGRVMTANEEGGKVKWQTQ